VRNTGGGGSSPRPMAERSSIPDMPGSAAWVRDGSAQVYVLVRMALSARAGDWG
jgi:hypothetical protein